MPCVFPTSLQANWTDQAACSTGGSRGQRSEPGTQSERGEGTGDKSGVLQQGGKEDKQEVRTGVRDSQLTDCLTQCTSKGQMTFIKRYSFVSFSQSFLSGEGLPAVTTRPDTRHRRACPVPSSPATNSSSRNPRLSTDSHKRSECTHSAIHV